MVLEEKNFMLKSPPQPYPPPPMAAMFFDGSKFRELLEITDIKRVNLSFVNKGTLCIFSDCNIETEFGDLSNFVFHVSFDQSNC